MNNFQNVGTFQAGIIGGSLANSGNQPLTLDATGIASGNAFLQAELEKRDPLIRKPLTSVTYPRDININTGGGWVDYVSAMQVGYGVTGGVTDSPVLAGGSDTVPMVQANMDKGIYKAHSFSVGMRIMFQDMQRSNFVGRSLDQMLTDGVRLAYDKHMDANVYIGIAKFGTTGLINNPDVVRSNATTGSWSTATAEQILADINTGLIAAWSAADYDMSALPNHILLPFEQYSVILSKPSNQLANESIMDYIMRNNVATKNGSDLFIGATAFCKGAGTGSTDRMVIYTNHERFVSVDELVPLTRAMSQPNVEHVCYDTAFLANVSEVQIFYPQTIRYYDGI